MKSLEPPSKPIGSIKIGSYEPSLGGWHWESDRYHGLLRKFDSGFPIDNSEYAILSISHNSNTCIHDWRSFQEIKNILLGEEWEGVELYPAESRKVDPSNRYYLWCVPGGVIKWGLPKMRRVLRPHESPAPQRDWTEK